jgi:mRNA interferase RelE/StbE
MTMPEPGRAGLPEFRIFETEEFVRALDKLPDESSEFVPTKLRSHAYPQLRDMPFYGPSIGKLRRYTPETWRYRIGRYRVFYHVDADAHIVYILTVEQRRDAYR